MNHAPVRRLGWGIADQAVSSLTNFTLLVVVAGAVGRSSFGALGIAFAAYAVAIGLGRALAGEPLTVRHSVPGGRDTRAPSSAALGVAGCVGIASGALLVVIGLGTGGVLGRALVPLGVMLPGLVLQDTWRFVFMAAGRPRAACANDALWAVVQCAGLAGIALAGAVTVPAAVLAWGVGANVAALVAARASGVRPNFRRARAWLRDERDLWPRFASEFVALTGSWQVALIGLGAVAGLDTVGSLRAAQVLVGPLNVAFLSVPLVAVPESARLWRAARGTPFQHAALVGGALAACAVVWGVVMALIPSGVGRDLLGATWPGARSALVPVVVVMAGVGATLGALCGLRVLAAARDSMWARGVGATLVVLAVVAGGAASGVTGAAWGWAGAAWAGAGVWWARLRALERRRARDATGGAVDRGVAGAECLAVVS